ncbi:MAG: TetR/AcrR family transcriptional regulator [Actinomycetota bacterium]
MTARRGRPPGPTDETMELVLQAAFRLLVTEGPVGLTPVRIHQETGVARTTVYRHWPTSAHIVDAIMTRAIARHELDQLTGVTAHDLPVAVATLTDRFQHRPVAAFYRATLEVGDPDERPTRSERYIEGLIAPVADVVADGVASGQLRGDAASLTSSLCGPLLLDHLLLGRPVDLDAIGQRVDEFLARHSAEGTG